MGGVGVFFFSSRRRHTRLRRDWSSDVCSSDLTQSIPSLTLSRWPFGSVETTFPTQLVPSGRLAIRSCRCRRRSARNSLRLFRPGRNHCRHSRRTGQRKTRTRSKPRRQIFDPSCVTFLLKTCVRRVAGAGVFTKPRFLFNFNETGEVTTTSSTPVRTRYCTRSGGFH